MQARRQGEAGDHEGGAAAAGGASPGKRARTDSLAVQRRAASTAPAAGAGDTPLQLQAAGQVADDPYAMHLVAQQGVAGAGGPVPHAESLQPLMPGLDLSSVRAHQGDDAQAASRAIGAEAYATGNSIALPPQPSRELVAHELTHVAQQRGGVSLSGGVGLAGDPYEREADAVAARVGAGQSAADLMPAASTGHGGRAVQRQAAEEQEAAEDVDVSADDIATAGAATGDAGLDVKWIDSLPARMLDQIDGSFAASKESAAYKKALAKDKELKEIEQAKKKGKAEVADATAERLGVANSKKNKKKIEKDDEYRAGTAAIDAEYADEVEAKKETIKQQVAKAGTKGKSWDDGRLAARINFMSWGVGLLGSADAVKTHFLGLEKIKGGAYLSGPAAARYNQAMAWFESTNPGSTFPDTSVGQALRGRHQGAHSKGLQGHPLGVSLDFDAYVNVHQKDGVASFMLRKFGGGPNQLELGEGSYQKVQAMGKASAEGKDLSEAQLAYLKDAEKAYDDMFATSEKFKNALGPSEARLKEVQGLYYDKVAPGNKAVAAIEKEIKAAKDNAGKKKGKGDADAGDGADDPVVAALVQKRDEKLATYEAEKAQVEAALKEVFGPWIAELEGEVAKLEEGHEREDLDAKVDYKTAARCVGEVKKAKNAKALRAILKKKPYAEVFVGFDAAFPEEEFASVKSAALTQAQQVEKAKYTSGEIAVQLKLIERFRSPGAVFGEDGGEKKNKETGELERTHKKEVSQPPIIQYLETGFARNDEMPAEGKKDQEVFNAEFVSAMMRFGWYPGAAWGAVDTMHFDFRDGFDAIQGGSKSFGPTD